MKEVKFNQLSRVPKTAGYYEIYGQDGVPLKCGIAKDLRNRLAKHRSSHSNGLQWAVGCGPCDHPDHAKSKRSILTKHLYFDRTLAPTFDFTVQSERRRFLLDCCFIRFVETAGEK